MSNTKKLLLYVTVSFNLINNALAIETIAPQAILQDYDTKTVIFEKSADEKVAPSSMSKLMTIYLVLERLKKGELNLEHKFSISKKAWQMQGSKMFVHVGDQVSIDDLLKGIIIQSGNDACISVAEGIAGSEESFAELMNHKAKDLGLTNSHFVNSTGWPEDEHLMTMRDLAKLSDAIIREFPEYYHYFSMKEFIFSDIKQQNRNSLLDMNSGVDGLKTGHTEKGGYGIAVSAKQNNRRMVAVVNGLNSHNERTNEAYKLLQYGFLNFDNVKLFEKGQVVSKLKISNAVANEIEATVNEDVVFTVPKAQVANVKHEIVSQELSAPVAKNQVIGKLTVTLPDATQNQTQKREFDLIAKQEVPSISWSQRIIKKIKSIFSL